jgi:hypothetical protein
VLLVCGQGTGSVQVAIGARVAAIGQSGEESRVVLSDAEGNGFCILHSLTGLENSSVA